MAVKTPCIGICSTVYGDDICRGCKRDYLEVIHWNSFTDDKKQNIINRLEEQKKKCSTDEELYELACKEYKDAKW